MNNATQFFFRQNMTSKYYKAEELIDMIDCDESDDGEINESESDDEDNNVPQINQVDYNYCLLLV